MQRVRAEDGYLGIIGIVAALVIVAILMATSVKLIGGSGGGGGGASGAATDSAAQAEAQHAYRALQRCAQSHGGTFAGCDLDQAIEQEPTLAAAAGHLEVLASAGSLQVTSTSSTGNRFTIALNGGAVTRSCTTAGVESCPTNGRW